MGCATSYDCGAQERTYATVNWPGKRGPIGKIIELRKAKTDEKVLRRTPGPRVALRLSAEILAPSCDTGWKEFGYILDGSSMTFSYVQSLTQIVSGITQNATRQDKHIDARRGFHA